MAKKIIRKVTRKADEHRVFINGKEQTVKTACKTFGQLYDESSQYGMHKTTFDLIGKCKQCAKQRPEICEACMVKSDQTNEVLLNWEQAEKATRKKKGPRKQVDKPFSIVIAKLLAGIPRKEICSDLVADGFPNNPRSFVNTTAGALNIFEGKKSQKPEGTVARTCQWLMDGAEGDKPKGDQGTQWYCIRTWEALQELREEME